MYTLLMTDKRKKLIEEIKKTADSAHMDLSQIIDVALEEWLKRHGSGNPAFDLTQWVDNSSFVPWPSIGHDSKKWFKWFNKADEKDLTEVASKLRWLSDKSEDFRRGRFGNK